MSEILGKTITDLEERISNFGKVDKSDEEITEFKISLKKDLWEISQDLAGLLKELRERLPKDLPWTKRDLLQFSGYGLRYILTKHGVEDARYPYNHENVECIVHGYMYPDLTKYKKEHHPSLAGAKFLCKRIAEIEMQLGIRLEGKYMINNEY